MKLKPNYVIIPLVTILTALIGGLFTSSGMPWYITELTKPELTPPSWVFPIAWNLIFLFTTIAALILWNQGKRKTKFLFFLTDQDENRRYWTIVWLFILNAIFNFTWSFLFFELQLITWAFIEMLLLEVSILAIMILAWDISKTATILLLPYAAWVAFATFLTYQIIELNIV